MAAEAAFASDCATVGANQFAVFLSPPPLEEVAAKETLRTVFRSHGCAIGSKSRLCRHRLGLDTSRLQTGAENQVETR